VGPDRNLLKRGEGVRVENNAAWVGVCAILLGNLGLLPVNPYQVNPYYANLF